MVVWARNSHLGDASATDMSHRGEVNAGQLARECYGSDATLVEFTTYAGTVTAATDGGGLGERKRVRPALTGSIEDLFHQAGILDFVLNLSDSGGTTAGLGGSNLERAIGVICLPETERISHYFHASIPHQFDPFFTLRRAMRWAPWSGTPPEERAKVQNPFPFGQ